MARGRLDGGEAGAKTNGQIATRHRLTGVGMQTVFVPVERVAGPTPIEAIGREVIPAVVDY